MEQKCVQQMSGDGCGRTCRSPSDRGHTVNPSGSGLSPICTPSERSPGRGRFIAYFRVFGLLFFSFLYVYSIYSKGNKSQSIVV